MTFSISPNGNEEFKVAKKTSVLPIGHKLIHLEAKPLAASSVNLRSSWSTVLYDAFDEDFAFWLSEDYSHYCLPIIQLFRSVCSSPTSIGGSSIYLAVGRIASMFPRLSSKDRPENAFREALTALPELQQFPTTKNSMSQENSSQLIDQLYGMTSEECPKTRSDLEAAASVLGAIAIFLQILSCSDVDHDMTPSSLGLLRLQHIILMDISMRTRYDTDTPCSAVQLTHMVFTGQSHYDEKDRYKVPAQSGRGICVYRAGIDNPGASPDLIVRHQVVRYVSLSLRAISIADNTKEERN